MSQCQAGCESERAQIVPRELHIKPVQKQTGSNPAGSLAAAGKAPGRGSAALRVVIRDAQRGYVGEVYLEVLPWARGEQRGQDLRIVFMERSGPGAEWGGLRLSARSYSGGGSWSLRTGPGTELYSGPGAQSTEPALAGLPVNGNGNSSVGGAAMEAPPTSQSEEIGVGVCHGLGEGLGRRHLWTGLQGMCKGCNFCPSGVLGREVSPAEETSRPRQVHGFIESLLTELPGGLATGEKGRAGTSLRPFWAVLVKTPSQNRPCFVSPATIMPSPSHGPFSSSVGALGWG